MKDEYLVGENQDHHPHSKTTNMFPKLPQSNTSSHDGASIEIPRRPRGRPPGSRNKPKPPIIITREPDPPMTPYVLELLPNVDIIETVTRFCRARAFGLCILSGSGSVSNVTLRQPSNATVTFHGRFDILSISATLFPNNIITNNRNNNNNNESGGPINGPCNFVISLAGPQGQVFGGAVMGPLASAGIVYLIGATFTNPSYQRLPLEEECRNGDVSGGGGGGGGGVQSQGRHQSPPVGSGGGFDSEHPTAEGMDMYSMHSDVIWAPTARLPQPPY